MPIEVARVAEDMSIEELVQDTNGILSTLAIEYWPKLADSKTLQFIDPWGDTVFNQAQLPALMEEVENFGATITSAETREHLSRVNRLIAGAVGLVHTYIKFIGD